MSVWKAFMHQAGLQLQQLGLKAGIAEIAEQMLQMGRRDPRTWRGKIFRGSFGKVRPRKHHSSGGWWNSPAPGTEVPIPFPPQHKSRFPMPADQPRQIEELQTQLAPS